MGRASKTIKIKPHRLPITDPSPARGGRGRGGARPASRRPLRKQIHPSPGAALEGRRGSRRQLPRPAEGHSSPRPSWGSRGIPCSPARASRRTHHQTTNRRGGRGRGRKVDGVVVAVGVAEVGELVVVLSRRAGLGREGRRRRGRRRPLLWRSAIWAGRTRPPSRRGPRGQGWNLSTRQRPQDADAELAGHHLQPGADLRGGAGGRRDPAGLGRDPGLGGPPGLSDPKRLAEGGAIGLEANALGPEVPSRGSRVPAKRAVGRTVGPPQGSGWPRRARQTESDQARP